MAGSVALTASTARAGQSADFGRSWQRSCLIGEKELFFAQNTLGAPKSWAPAETACRSRALVRVTPTARAATSFA